MSSNPDLTALLGGRTAVVTGGAMGIGRAVAVRLAQAGADVVVADADGDAAEHVATGLVDVFAGLQRPGHVRRHGAGAGARVHDRRTGWSW